MSLAEIATKQQAALEVLPAVPPADAAGLYRAVHAFFVKSVQNTLELSLPRAKQFKALQNDVVWAYSSPRLPTKLNSELEGAGLALLSRFHKPGDVLASLVGAWVARGGLPFALEAVAASVGRFKVAQDEIYLVESDDRPWVPLLTRPDMLIRSHLVLASSAEVEAARAKAVELRGQGTLASRSLLSSIFLDSQWIDADLTERNEKGGHGIFTELALLHASASGPLSSFLGALTSEEAQFPRPFAHALLARFPGAQPLACWLRRAAVLVRGAAPYHRAPHLGALGELVAALEFAPESEVALSAVTEALTVLQGEKLRKAEDPRPGLTRLLRASPGISVALVKKAAQKKASWAADLAPQLERASLSATPKQGAASPDTFWLPEAFVRPRLSSGQPLGPEAIEALGQALRRRDLAAVARIKASCSLSTLASFAWDLFSAWLAAGAPMEERWAFEALGALGDDETARRLTPLIRSWPGEFAHQRAVLGLDVLAAIGTDTALRLLDGVAQKVKYRALQDRARESIEAIAQRRGMTREALGDRLVPDLGLDADGSKTLSFGARTFRVGFDEQLKPFLTDPSGRRLEELPRPNAKDDLAASTRSLAEWKELKRALKGEASNIVLRLELAMAEERRWSPKEFQDLLVCHPLLIHLVRSLLWGLYAGDGRLRIPFRIDADKVARDFNGESVALSSGVSVGVVHPLRLKEDEAAVLADAFAGEFRGPFAQLNREVFVLGPREWDSASLTRFEGRTAATSKLRGLRERGWRLGPAQDAGFVNRLLKPIGGGGVALLNLEDGFPIKEYERGGSVSTLGCIDFEDDGEPATRPVDERSPVMISELIRDIEAIVDPELS